MVRTDERRLLRFLGLRIPRDARDFFRLKVLVRVLRRLRLLGFDPDDLRLLLRFIAKYLRRPAFNLPLRFPLRFLFAIVFFLLVVFFVLKIESKLLLYSLSTIPVVIGLLRYNGERGVRLLLRRTRRLLRRGFSKSSCFIHFRDELRVD